MTSSTDQDADGIWVISDVAPDGTYVATVQAGPDVAVTLDRDRAVAYALTVIEAANRAEYDAAVFGQMTSMGLSERTAVGSVMDLRQDRSPLDDASTAPLRFVPIMAARTKAGALYVEVNGQRVSQWTVDDTLGHAHAVLRAVTAADLDAGYYRYLTGVIGTEDFRARAAVADIASHRSQSGAGG